MRTTHATASRIATAATLLLICAVAALHWRAASAMLSTSLLGDQPKHFITGVMVYDYMRTGIAAGLAISPVRFAEEFEVRYPLVSIGHWPPMYYAVQGTFFLIAGPSMRSAQILSALTACLLALLIFFPVKRRAGARTGLIAASVFLVTPLMQTAAWQIMSDLLTGLFVYLAIVAFARLLDEPGNWKAALAFALWAVAAIFTKGSAWALGPFFLLAPLLARRLSFFRTRWFWGTALLVVLLGSSFYVVAERTGIGYPANLVHYLTTPLALRLSMLLEVLHFAPVLLIGTCILGLADALHARLRQADQADQDPWTTLSLVAGAWILAQIVFLLLLPMTPEPRVLLPSLAPAAVLTARLLLRVQRSLQRTPAFAAIAPVFLGILLLLSEGVAPLPRLDGYRQAANTMPYPPDGALILAGMDAGYGEEAMIAERLSQGRAHRDVILRASHVLAELDSAGNDQMRFQSTDAVRAYLVQMPVRFVVLSSPPFHFAYQAQLESAVTGDPQDFHFIATVPTSEEPGGLNGELRIYENPAARNHHPSVVRTPLGYDAGRRMLEYHWK